ncbi:MFS general substrate transporter [Karstenula rhodostoma CBS 690.94]|uniref:MFS general substrate transporter n=1 Tax=Karstenula rhodostoma CBS 690.94 TaxID=1392251 RepID=A0A9P4PH59_9PLEO|nr:MFS general substrate transporter [Karstenula rhodostoma CBS 690.94]
MDEKRDAEITTATATAMSPDAKEHPEGPERMALSGVKLNLLTLSLCLSLFLSLLDSTIVSTALVKITSGLGGFERSSWVVNSYLLTYTGFLITAKLSDIFGRRALVAAGLAIFVVSSHRLPRLRGGAMYTMTFVILPEMCTPDQYTLYSAIISCVATMSSLFGPIFGGLISQKTDWRWIFWLNRPESPALGALLMLSATTLFLTALEESGTGTPWSAPLVLAPLLAGLVLYAGLLLWSKAQATRTTAQEPLLSWHVLSDRFCLGLFAQAFWMATIMFSLTVALPQRFQVVDGASALAAGYRLLPVTLLLLVGNATQTLGVGLLVLQPAPLLAFPASRYTFEAIVGFGLGFTSAVTVLSTVLYFAPRDISVGMGGAIGVAASVNILNRYTAAELGGTLTAAQMAAIKRSAEAVAGFPEDVQRVVREAYARGWGWQAVALTGFGGMGLVMLGLLGEAKMRRLEKHKKAEER